MHSASAQVWDRGRHIPKSREEVYGVEKGQRKMSKEHAPTHDRERVEFPAGFRIEPLEIRHKRLRHSERIREYE
jgi:putative ubiquitin-RnfH superfamily antitoxin RatB of RatAB toxin-antitoxin module